MTLPSAFAIGLAIAALALLARDLQRAWRDRQRRPVTLLAATAVAVLFAGTLGGRAEPDPWWLALPAALLAWEAARGWRRTPRSRLWEAGMAAFAAALLFGAAGFASGAAPASSVLLSIGAVSGLVGLALLGSSRRREPRPWRAEDSAHYERRSPGRQRTKVS